MSQSLMAQLRNYLVTAGQSFDVAARAGWVPGDREKQYERVTREIVTLVGKDGTPIHDALLEQAPAWEPKDVSAAAHLHTALVDALSVVDPDSTLLLDVAANPRMKATLRARALAPFATKPLTDYGRELILRIAKGRSSDELRAAAFRVLVAHGVTDVLPVLTESPIFQDSVLTPEDLLLMRAQLGDTSALRPLIRTAYGSEDRQLFVVITRETVATLEGKIGGTAAAVKALAPGEPSEPLLDQLVSLAVVDEEVRPWALERLLMLDPLFDAGRKVFDGGDSVSYDVAVALSRCEGPLLVTLQHLARNRSATSTQRLWAIYTLLLLEDFVPHSTYAGIDDDHVVVQGVRGDVRRGIMRRYASRVRAGSDVRWLIEAQEMRLAKGVDDLDAEIAIDASRHADLVDALAAARVTLSSRRGSELYVDGLQEDAQVVLSGCGPFVTFYSLWHSHHPIVETCRSAAEDAGFLWFDQAMMEVRLPGLFVGDLASPTVGQLLFG